jgi:hypothetical protein
VRAPGAVGGRERRQGRPAPVPRRAPTSYIPPRKGDKHALRIIREVFARGREAPGTASSRWRPSELPRRVWAWFRGLQATSTARAPRRSTSIAAALEFCRKVLPRRAVVFVVSDFLDDGYLTVLRNANRKHDVVAAVVTDPREQEFVPAGLVTLEDAETGATRLVDTRSAAYRARVAADATARLTAGSGEDSSRRPASTWCGSTPRARWSIRCCASSASASGGPGDERARAGDGAGARRARGLRSASAPRPPRGRPRRRPRRSPRSARTARSRPR